MDLFTGRETPGDILKVAYSLEQGLRDFYETMEKKAFDPKVRDLFAKLGEIEIKHQASIYEAYEKMDPAPVSRDDFEKTVEAAVLEGGMTTDQYLDRFKPDLGSEKQVLSLAMSIEAQALDLYQRTAATLSDSASKGILHKIADEEKAHLTSLGRLMDSL